jgi:hypothetical protein
MQTSFFFDDAATAQFYTELYALTLHDALPIALFKDPVRTAL